MKAAQRHRQQRVFTGVVVSAAMHKTIVVKVARMLWHAKYQRQYSVSKKYLVHDEKNQHKVGDTVRFVETRPLSKNKRWRVATQEGQRQ